MAFAHEFSWSTSRAGTFAACRRRYYHDYYSSWNGWSKEAAPERQQAYMLKKMTRMPQLAGTVLHEALAEYFDRHSEGQEMTADEVLELACSALREGYRESRAGAWRQRPAKYCHLAEHHYEEVCIDESGSNAAEYGKLFIERLRRSVDCFFSAPEMHAAREATAAEMLSVEGRPPGDRANRGFATIQMAETKVFAIPDFAHRNSEQGQPQHVIYDWKTGNPREQDEFQLGVYVFFAMEKWGAKPEDVLAVDAYLTRGEFKSLRFSSERMAGIRDRLEGSLAEMRSLHFDADESMGDPEDFPLIADSGAAECTGCNYRELCGR